MKTLTQKQIKSKYTDYKIDWFIDIDGRKCDVITLYGNFLVFIKYEYTISAERYKTLKKGETSLYTYSSQPWFLELEQKCATVFDKPIARREFTKSFIKEGE